MKVQIDTTEKVIRVEETVNLGELTKFLAKILPNNEWKTYKLETNTVINWGNPIIIEKWNTQPILPYIPYSPTPFHWGTTTCQLNSSNTFSGNNAQMFNTSLNKVKATQGIFNFHLQ